MSEFDPLEVLRVLERHRVRYVVIGAVAARIAGAPLVTQDIDVTPAGGEANLERLCAALRVLDARLRVSEGESVPFAVDPEMLRTSGVWTLTTRAGDLGLCFTPSGTGGYADLRRDSSRQQLAGDLTVSVASLRDVIRSKEAANRLKDQGQLPLLRLTLERIREREAKRRPAGS